MDEPPKWNDNDRETLRRKVEYYKSKNPNYIPWARIGKQFSVPRDGKTCKIMYNKMIKYPQTNHRVSCSLPPKKRPLPDGIEHHVRTYLAKSVTRKDTAMAHSEIQNGTEELKKSADALIDIVRNELLKLQNELVVDVAKRRFMIFV